MPLRTVASFAIAIFLGLIAVVLVRGLLISSRPAGSANASATMTPVVVAALPIDRGTALKPIMLKVVAYPRDSIPAGAFQSLDLLVGKNAPVRTTLRSVAANEPVLASKLSGAGAKTNLSGVIEPGMRAVSVRASDVSGVGGFALPGDRVDVLMTRTVGAGDAARPIVQVLAENVVVLGVDQTSDPETDKPVVAKAVTVQVTPDQAQAISLGQTIGQISLDLRQSADNAVLTKRVTTVADLGPGGGAAPAKPKVRKVRLVGAAGMSEVHVTRGVEATSYSVGGY